jgi:excisionase family DNA binding protein
MNKKQKPIQSGEACELLGIARNTLYKLVDRNKIEFFITPGGHYRFNVKNINKIIKGRCNKKK